MLQIMDRVGVPLVEFQFPFSEPMADGPVFCRANQQSIAQGTTVDQCFDLMQRASTAFSFAPIMMGYYNTAYNLGHDTFCQRLAQAGGRGYILPDLPPDSADGQALATAAAAQGLAPINLFTPTNTTERLNTIAHNAQGFVYAVARRGVTGQRTAFDPDIAAFLQRCRAITSLPIAVGFGIGTPADIQFLRPYADIAVIGTAFLQAWEEGGPQKAEQLLTALIQA